MERLVSRLPWVLLFCLLGKVRSWSPPLRALRTPRAASKPQNGSWIQLLERSDGLDEAPPLDRLLALASRELPPETALLRSPKLRPAVRILLNLRAKGLEMDLLIDCALEQLQQGQLDWPQVCSRMSALSPYQNEAEEAIRLLTLGNNQAHEVVVSSGDGLTFQGLWKGESIKACLEKSEEDGWGQWATYFLSEAPEDLRGQRLVACKRPERSGSIFNQQTGFPSLSPGDTLYFATPDRAAVLELATFDQLPEFATELARVLREGVEERAVVCPAEMLEAARFVNGLRDANAQEQAERRLYRFEKSKVARRSYEALLRDELWREFWELVRHRVPELYRAVREAMLRSRPATSIEPRRVPVIRINILAVLALLLVFGALVYCAWQVGQPKELELPLYSLRNDAEP